MTLSIISHGQGPLITELLGDLAAFDLSNVEIVLTVNIPESLAFLRSHSALPLRVIENAVPMGFGANHNQAFRAGTGRFFCIVNPDIRLTDDSFRSLPAHCDDRTGACAPLVVDSTGHVQDSARRAPTIARLFARAVLRRRGPDYVVDRTAIDVDWLAGMFVVFRREAFAAVGGFDDRYFMYMEDADIGRRLRGKGWGSRLVPTLRVIHDAQRASHRDTRHLRWHVRGVIRYLLGI
jgi:hypothetical protein